MTLSGTSQSEALKEAKLPRRDWILLPLIGLFTILFLMVFTELISRRMFSSVENTLAACLVFDPSTGVRGRPNTSCMYKKQEYPLAEYKFNDCGYRAGMECVPKPSGSYRIVLLGSSYSLGFGVSRESTFAALLPNELSRKAGRSVELYNEGMYMGTPLRVVLSFNDALAAKPDMILWPLTPFDIEHVSILGGNDSQLQDASAKDISLRSNMRFGAAAVLTRLKEESRGTAFLVRHLLYLSQSQYLRAYLSSESVQSEFLRSETSANWKDLLRQFDAYFAEVEARASAAGVPIVVVMVPDRATAAMISTCELPEGYDPYKLGEELRTIVTHRGGTYIDILPDFLDVPSPASHYFPVDDHPDAEGHAVISNILAKELTSGAVPALSAATR